MSQWMISVWLGGWTAEDGYNGNYDNYAFNEMDMIAWGDMYIQYEHTMRSLNCY